MALCRKSFVPNDMVTFFHTNGGLLSDIISLSYFTQFFLTHFYFLLRRKYRNRSFFRGIYMFQGLETRKNMFVENVCLSVCTCIFFCIIEMCIRLRTQTKQISLWSVGLNVNLEFARKGCYSSALCAIFIIVSSVCVRSYAWN